MKISIITITFNSDKTVRDTLASVSSQSYHDIEHIIVDGKSTDNTLEIVKEFPSIARIHSGKDKGIYDAMNKGLELATGDVIGILNSDDVYHSDYVVEKVAALFIGTDIDGVYGNLNYVQHNDLDKVTRKWEAGKYGREKFLNGWMPPHPTFFVKREVYEKYGNFNTDLRFSADYEIMLRFMYKNKIEMAYLPDVLVKMRLGGLSNSSLKNRLKANREDKLAWICNDLKPRWYIRWIKPLRKVFQYRFFI